MYEIEEIKRYYRYCNFCYPIVCRVPEEEGVFEASGVKITLNTNKIIEYPVEKWTFDIGRSTEEIVNTWESPGASSSSEKFAYDYSIKNSDAVITKIYYGR